MREEELGWFEKKVSTLLADISSIQSNVLKLRGDVNQIQRKIIEMEKEVK